jgi:hypothetical protein
MSSITLPARGAYYYTFTCKTQLESGVGIEAQGAPIDIYNFNLNVTTTPVIEPLYPKAGQINTAPSFGVIKSTQICFVLGYYCSNNIASGYPKIMIDSTTYAMTLNTNILKSLYSFDYPYGVSIGTHTYQYFSKSINDQTLYETSTGTFVIVSSAPEVAKNKSTFNKENAPTTLTLIWESSQVDGYKLSYKIYICKKGEPYPDTPVYHGGETSLAVSRLSNDTDYSWRVVSEIVGAEDITSVQDFDFHTVKSLKKLMNAPNPFSPPDQQTTIKFSMTEPGTADIEIRSEYGDLCWSSDYQTPNVDNTLVEIKYDGRDGQGKLMYNGTYVLIVKKNYYSGKRETEISRLMIIK